MSMTWTDYATQSYLAGVAISFADRLFSQNAKKHTAERMESKTRQVAALEYLREVQTGSVTKDEKDYFDAVKNARTYFINRGISCSNNIGFIGGLVERAKMWKNSERINSLDWRQKLALAFLTEFGITAGTIVTRALFGVGNVLHSAGRSLYEGPCLFLGLQTGKAFLYAKDFMMRSKQEKELDEMGREMTQDGKLLEIVRSYSPTASMPGRVVEPVSETSEPVETAQAEGGARAPIDVGAKVGDAINAGMDTVSRTYNSMVDRIKKRAQDRAAMTKKEKEAERARLRARYDKY